MEGVLDSDTATLLTRTLAFSGHTAADVMTPRPRLSSVDPALGIRRGRARARAAHRLLPLPGDRRGRRRRRRRARAREAGDGGAARPTAREVPVGAIETKALRVPETMTLDSLLGELRGRGYQMAVVIDEYGGTAGVATLEDLVEELVGDLVDEHDRTRAGVVRGRDSLTFPGILRPDELADQAGVRVPESGPVRDRRRLRRQRARPAAEGRATRVTAPSRAARGAAPGRPADRPPALPRDPYRRGRTARTSAVAP